MPSCIAFNRWLSCSIAAEKKYFFWIRERRSKEWRWVRSADYLGNTNTTSATSPNAGSRWTSVMFCKVRWRSCFLIIQLSRRWLTMWKGRLPYGTRSTWRLRCEGAFHTLFCDIWRIWLLVLCIVFRHERSTLNESPILHLSPFFYIQLLPNCMCGLCNAWGLVFQRNECPVVPSLAVTAGEW